ncbi:MAG: hypothetical protein WDN24_02825 [Sphingomonas sp.]
MRRYLPRSLPGQIALLVAVALFVAQAINFGLLLRERRETRFNSVIVPAVTRLVDTAERPGGAPGPLSAQPPGRRGGMRPGEMRQRVQLVDANPIDPAAPRRADIEAAIATGMRDMGQAPRQVIATIRPIDASEPVLRRIDPIRRERLVRMGAELIVAVERSDGKWLALRAAWPRTERILIWQLIAQTLLYVVVLIPVLLAGRPHRASRCAIWRWRRGASRRRSARARRGARARRRARGDRRL